MDTHLYNLMGWSNVHDSQSFHTLTNHVWEYVLNEPTKSGRENLVKQHMINPLRRTNPRLNHRTPADLVTTLATFRLAPEPYATNGNKPGLGPMVHVSRTFLERSAVSDQRHINAEATSVTTADVVKAKLGAPIIPRDVYEVTEVLKSMAIVLEYLFTVHCPLLIPLKKIIEALGRTSPLFEMVKDYQYTVAAEILWQITLETQKFFDDTISRADVIAGRRLEVNLHWLADSISRGSIPASINRPPAFCPPPDRKRNNDSRRDRRGTNRQLPTPSAAPDTRAGNTPKRSRTDPAFEPHTRTLNTACSAIMMKYPRSRFPLISDVRAVGNFATDADLSKHLGVEPDDCLKYTLYGKCPSPMCRRLHRVTRTSAAHATLLEKVLKAKAQTST